MTDLIDIQHIYGDDVEISPTGDLAAVSQEKRTQLRIIRRLMTPNTVLGSSAYPWLPEYGVGLGKRVGKGLNIREIQAIVLSQILLEPSVARIPVPDVSVVPTLTEDGAVISINYFSQAGLPQSFSFNLTD